jgi:predicted dehydrogenase
MHGEWTIKALQKGKHVLLEKPFTANAEEAKRVVEVAREKNLIVMEAFHWQCHPAARAFKSLLSKVSNLFLKTMSRPAEDVKSMARLKRQNLS